MHHRPGRRGQRRQVARGEGRRPTGRAAWPPPDPPPVTGFVSPSPGAGSGARANRCCQLGVRRRPDLLPSGHPGLEAHPDRSCSSHGLDGRRLLGGLGGQAQVGVDRTVEDHRPDTAREQLSVGGSECGPVGQAVVVDPPDSEGGPQSVHVPGRGRGVHRREQLRVVGPAGTLQAGEDEGGRRRPGDRTAGFCGGRSAGQRLARSRPSLIEAHEGESVAYRSGHERSQDGKDENAALTGSARIEDDDALAVGRAVFDHGQADRAPRRILVLERDRQRPAQVSSHRPARRPTDVRRGQGGWRGAGVGHRWHGQYGPGEQAPGDDSPPMATRSCPEAESPHEMPHAATDPSEFPLRVATACPVTSHEGQRATCPRRPRRPG